MKPWAEMSAAGRGGVLGGVAAVIAVVFYGAWTVSRPPAPVALVGEVTATGTAATGGAVVPEDEGAGEAVAAVAPAAEPVAPAVEGAAEGDAEVGGSGPAEEPGSTAEASADAVVEDAAGAAEVAALADPVAPEGPVVVPPSFDLVRVEQDGSALVAGSAMPDVMLSLRVTGEEIVTVPTDAQGNFVAMFNLAPSEAPRVLSLVMLAPDGGEVPAEGTVVIAPTVAPVAMAAVAPAVEGVAEAAPGAEAGSTEQAAAEAAPVMEPQAPAALLVTEEGARVLQSASDMPPELVANVTIDTITYTPEGAVQLAGRGTPGRVVRLYLDNAPLAEAAISAAGDWAVTLPEVTPGIFALRADQVDAAGAVTSRFETPFKRETVAALAAASVGVEAPSTGASAGAATGAAAGEVAADPSAAPAADTAPQAASAPVTVTVQPGFTLWQIATERLGAGVRYVQVFEANRAQIRDPDLIYPGQVFAIPDAE